MVKRSKKSSKNIKEGQPVVDAFSIFLSSPAINPDLKSIDLAQYDGKLKSIRLILEKPMSLTIAKDAAEIYASMWRQDKPAQAYFFRLVAAEFLPKLVKLVEEWPKKYARHDPTLGPPSKADDVDSTRIESEPFAISSKIRFMALEMTYMIGYIGCGYPILARLASRKPFLRASVELLIDMIFDMAATKTSNSETDEEPAMDVFDYSVRLFEMLCHLASHDVTTAVEIWREYNIPNTEVPLHTLWKFASISHEIPESKTRPAKVSLKWFKAIITGLSFETIDMSERNAEDFEHFPTNADMDNEGPEVEENRRLRAREFQLWNWTSIKSNPRTIEVCCDCGAVVHCVDEATTMGVCGRCHLATSLGRGRWTQKALQEASLLPMNATRDSLRRHVEM